MNYSQAIPNYGQAESKWILGSAKTDLLWFYAPALLLISIAIGSSPLMVGHTKNLFTNKHLVSAIDNF